MARDSANFMRQPPRVCIYIYMYNDDDSDDNGGDSDDSVGDD